MIKSNLKNIIIILFIILLGVIVIDVIVKRNSEIDTNKHVDNINDKTWSESSIFTNVEYQKRQIQDIKDEYLAFDYPYSLKDPYIVVNPYDINPLSAYVIFSSQEPVKYSYEVVDQSSNLNFVYENSTYSNDVIIPILGLFENINNTVNIKVENKKGKSQSTVLTIPTGPATYYPVDVDMKKEVEGDILNGWYFDAFYNGFDTNGNIRYNLNVGVEDNYMKFYDNHIFVKVDNYQTIYEIDFMGKILAQYQTPSSEYNFHHDLVKTDEGVVYALGSYNVDLPNIPYAESLIFEYEKPGKPSRIIDIYDLFSKNLVSPFGTPNQNDPIHINSIEYLKEEDELVISSQAQSFIAAINIKTQDLDWIIQDEKSNLQNKDKQLEILNPQTFEKTSGQHTVFLTNNSKYDEYRSENDYIFSIFNNNNCKDQDGNLLFKKYEDPIQGELCTYNVSDVLVYDINVKDKTVQQIDSIVIDQEYAPIMSSVFDVNDNFIIHYNQGSSPTSFLTNADGEVLIKFSVKDYSGNGYYRTNFLTQDKLNNLVEEATND